MPERGFADVSEDVWRRLVVTRSFWALVDRKIVSISHPVAKGARLHGGSFVGRITCGEILVELHEKLPGALQALLRFASHETFYVAAAPSPSSELGELVVLLIQQFLAAVAAYVTRGRQAVYVRERRTGSLVGGRMRLTDTIRLRARGLGHMIAFDRTAISYKTNLNRVVYGALREVEQIAATIPLPSGDKAQARAFAMLFSDCHTGRLRHEERLELVTLAERCATDELAGQLRDIAALASVVLAHQSFEHETSTRPSVPRAWFLNLEKLFETACRSVLRQICWGRFVVDRRQLNPPQIFQHEAHEYRAYPDLVIRAEEAHAIGDVKYKEWTGRASASDVYQLLVHASAFETDCCFLVFPSDRYEMRELGGSVTGALTWLFAIDIRAMDRDLRLAMDATGLIAAAVDAAAVG